MGWREADRLANIAFREVALQATYAFRQGNPVPPGAGTQMVGRAVRRVGQSKALVAALLGFLILGSAALLFSSAHGVELIVPFSMQVGLYQAGVLTGLLGLEVALLWWTGLQALPTYLGSPALAVLATLPVDRPTLRRAAVLLYLRLFDLPALVVVVATPLFVGVALGPLAGVAAIVPAVSAVAFALALSLLTGRFFVRRVQGARGGGGAAVVRWAYLLLWLLPAFGLLIFVTASPPFFRTIAGLANPAPPLATVALAAVYPFALALWPAYASGGLAAPPVPVPHGLAWIAVASGTGYAALTACAVVWLYTALVDASIVPPAPLRAASASTFVLRPQAPMWAVLTKDLRLASRTPGYAFLILLPLLDAVALGLVTYAGSASASAARGIALGAVTVAALLATFFGPAFFALEVIAQSYGRTLPLAPRSMAAGKVALIGAVFAASGGIVLAITSARVHAPALFAAFVGAELPAVLAAGFVELAVLFRWARRRGMPVTNLYSGTWNVLLVSLPGVAIAGLPLATFVYAGLVPMALVALAELAVAAGVALRRGAR
jgi:hypothetical protein